MGVTLAGDKIRHRLVLMQIRYVSKFMPVQRSPTVFAIGQQQSGRRCTNSRRLLAKLTWLPDFYKVLYCVWFSL